MIRLEGVEKVFPRAGGEPVVAVRGLDLEVRRGETFCLIGASGCGKTTLLRLINRLEEPTAGRILVDGDDVASADPIRLRRRMGYVIQAGGLFPHLTVEENVGLLCRLEGMSKRDASVRARELLAMVRLAPGSFAERFPTELSGGQRQRVGIARALALDPEIVLMDEPFGALDPITRTQVQEEFSELRREVEKTVVIVTHDLDEAFRLGDRVGLMSEGNLVQVGTLEDFRAEPRTAYVERFLERHLDAAG